MRAGSSKHGYTHVCPDCGGKKSFVSKRCYACFLNTKGKPVYHPDTGYAKHFCPECGSLMSPSARSCRSCMAERFRYRTLSTHRDKEGYVLVRVDDERKWVLEHHLKAEAALGRRMRKDEVVHHINFDKGDNRNTNLIICTRAYHHRLHNRMAYLYAKEHFC